MDLANKIKNYLKYLVDVHPSYKKNNKFICKKNKYSKFY